MILTKDQWFVKLKAFVPEGFFEKEENNVAHVKAVAKLLEVLQQDAQDHVDNTFILKSNDEFVDEHGRERTIKRVTSETDPTYAERVRNLLNQSNCPDIKDLVDKFLAKGVATIIEHFRDAPFMNRENFMNRGSIFVDVKYNAFSIIVDRQLHDPYSFVNRENFMNREDFVGTNKSSQRVFDIIVNSINENKALGTVYRVVERI